MTLENDIRMERLDKTKEAAAQTNEELDWPNLKRFQKENEEVMKSDNDKIVFMGDSITEGWAVSNPAFFKKNNFINRGIGGQTTPQMLIRFKQDAIHLNPKMVIINGGTNDIAENNGPSTPEMIIDNITAMAEICSKNKITVALSTITPVYSYSWNKEVIDVPGKISQVNSSLKKYSNQNNIPFIDYYSAMVDGQKGLLSAYGSDGVHPTKEGYKVMVDVLKNTIPGIE
jgi:lysophospholipase L1-like esterase